ncbi:hypothetical protein MLD38_014548 [Melastoma candidum]|uniref:Uncharacterized protein n=1 Tax=Melastoma candidum TaxID=119954 RepID=A0ACB9RHD4_9MYRT|nr:hypothetical protein MLD38_014548 [Melastoma candidum]
MRAGAYTIQQTLSVEAASVLKHSLGLARRRGHAQVTPLHVAATLLSSRSSVLRRACLKSQQHPTPNANNGGGGGSSSHPRHHPLQCRALELCFNVALNRLPTSPSPLLHGCQATLSNALVAALKRAQAHQRRGCVEQQQQQQQNQQPLLTVKVELEQLVISILDDPSVSRVMREAGFSSSAIKSNIEDTSPTSPVFHGYGSTTSGGGGVFSSPSSPTHAEYTLRGESTVIPSLGTFWHTQSRFLRPFHSSPPVELPGHDSIPPKEDDIKLVLEVMLRKKRRNMVIVGDSRSATDGLVMEIMGRIERGEVPGELKSSGIIKFQFAPLSFRYMKSADVGSNIAELKRKIDDFLKEGGGTIIYAGDLAWAAEDKCGPVDQLISEMGKLLSSYLGSPAGGDARVWLLGTANLQTYINCQKRRPPLEVEWGMQAVSVPTSGGLGLSLHAEAKSLTSPIGNDDASRQVVEVKPVPSKDVQLTCCAECTSNFHKEAAFFSTPAPNKLLPSWLQSPEEDLSHLKVKWNKVCGGLHQERTKNCIPLQRHSWWPFQTGILPDSNPSITFASQSLSTVARFRGQRSNAVEFGSSRWTGKNQGSEPNLDFLRNSEGKEVKITLSLGNALFCDSGKLAEHNIERMLQRGNARRLLQDNVPWQSEAIPSIVDALFNNRSTCKDTWLLIHGNDTIGKRRLARAVAEAVFGSSDLVITINTRARNSSYSEIFTRISKDDERLVVLVENVDLADKQLVKFLSECLETGKTSDSGQGRGGGRGQVVYILTKGDSVTGRGDDDRESRDTVIKMEARVVETTLEAGIDLKRKADWELPEKLKVLKTGGKVNRNGHATSIHKKVASKQSWKGIFDLNEEAREDGGGKDVEEVSPNSSDLTGESGGEVTSGRGLLGGIENQYSFNRSLTRDREMKELFMTKIRGSGEEVYGGGDKVRFKVEEGVLEGGGDKVGEEEKEEGYMNTCLPKTIHTPSSGY